ncbi:MAG TPA: heavy metal-associated domain-containing protein [Bacteroidales bacterium]|nr:heavy metal-associated domain-containing protein [Bacteroidales bacterium]
MKQTIVILLILLSVAGFAQQKKSDTVNIKTSAVCGMCKDRIEGGLAFEKGVKKAELNDETKVLTVVFNPSRTSPSLLRKIVSRLGYDADSVAADPVAYSKLPACCKKDAPKH